MKEGPMPTTDDFEILREKDRFKMTKMSRIQWWRLEKMGKVPKRIPLGENSVGWLKGELECWIAARAAARR